MITERLFCVKRCEVAISLNPGAAAHPNIHHYGSSYDYCQRQVKNRVRGPLIQIAKRLEKVHPEKTSQEGQRHEQDCNNGQGLHDLIHAIVRDRKVRVENTADQIAQAFVEIM